VPETASAISRSVNAIIDGPPRVRSRRTVRTVLS
jgi:hypothetical protein